MRGSFTIWCVTATPCSIISSVSRAPSMSTMLRATCAANEMASLVYVLQGLAADGAHHAILPGSTLPTLPGAQCNADHQARWQQASASTPRCRNVLHHVLAIFQADHSSASLWKIAETFFESTSNAAVSASALSLRSSSRYGAKLLPQLPFRYGRKVAQVVREAPGPTALFVTGVPVNPNIARRTRNAQTSSRSRMT